jgi:hypothetical protein
MIVVQSQLGQIVCEVIFLKNLSQKRAGGVAQGLGAWLSGGALVSHAKALGLIPCTEIKAKNFH